MNAMTRWVTAAVPVLALLGSCTGTGRPPTLFETVAGCLHSPGAADPGGATARDLHARRTEVCADDCGEKRNACALFCGEDPDPDACRSRCDDGRDACVTHCAGPPPID